MRNNYRIHGVDIFIDEVDEKWSATVEKKIENQLSAYPGAKDTIGCQKMCFRNYDNLLLKADLNEAVASGDGTYLKGRLLVDVREETALKVGPNYLEVWVGKDTWFSIPNMLQILLLQRRLTFIHGACVSANGKGILLVAAGGTGKTAFISRICGYDWIKILGDDLAIIDEKGVVYPYYRPFCLYRYHRDLFPEFFRSQRILYKDLTLFNRAVRKVKHCLGVDDISIYNYIPISPFRIFEKTKIEESSVPLAMVFVLRKMKGISRLRVVENVNEEIAATFSMGIFLHEFNWLAKITSNLLMSECGALKHYQDDVLNIYRQSFSEKMIYAIDIPEALGASETALQLTSVVSEIVVRRA